MKALARPPGPRQRLLTGNLRDFRRDVLGFLEDTARQYGDVALFRLGHRPCVLVNHPDLIESVLVKNSRNFVKPFAFRFTRPVLGNGLLTSEGEFWLRQRRLAAPAFRAERIASYDADMVAAAERMMRRWQDGETRDIHADMMQVTLDIVATTLFGADVTGQSHEVEVSLRAALSFFSASFNRAIPLPTWIPTKANRRARSAVRGLNRVVQRLIDQRRGENESRNDLLSMMLAARDDDGSQMTDEQLADEARTFLLAGHETTAITLSWSFYLLATHPSVQAKLQAELQHVLGDRLPRWDDLPRLEFAERVIREAMRLYPPAFVIGREPLTDIELGGYAIPAGTTIFMSPWVMHHDERFYPRPGDFEPDRWSAEQVAARPKMAYFPFGGGPRICIGHAFAMMESVLVLSTIAQKWSMQIDGGHPIVLSPVFTLRPKFGIKIVLHERQGQATAQRPPNAAQAARDPDAPVAS